MICRAEAVVSHLHLGSVVAEGPHVPGFFALQDDFCLAHVLSSKQSFLSVMLKSWALWLQTVIYQVKGSF